jgi:predicted DsbA family dithiol-disulfide isomerase
MVQLVSCSNHPRSGGARSQEFTLTLSIDIVSDVVCPWCFIGKRKLEAALALYRERNPEAAAPKVTWHPFQLNPDMPQAGMDRGEYVARKFGARGRDVYGRVSAAGREAGIAFAFDKVVKQPNTLAAHGLIALAEDAGKQDEVVEALFRAYFIDGKDLTSEDTLAGIAAEAGLDADEVRTALASEDARAHVSAEEGQARAIGVEGVPFFTFNRRLAVSGAQGPEVLLEAMLEAEKQPAEVK